MSKTFSERMREDRRLVVLRLLAEQPVYEINSSNVHAGLQHLGLHCSRADLLDDLRWLARQGLVQLTPLPDIDALYLCRLRRDGRDVAQGLQTVPGISRPAPM